MEHNWDFLLSEFRRLGGIADNVCQKEGENGRGIFSINPSLKARIFTPSLRNSESKKSQLCSITDINFHTILRDNQEMTKLGKV
jgi:hypothetical protein